jgi:hypothetical protein
MSPVPRSKTLSGRAAAFLVGCLAACVAPLTLGAPSAPAAPARHLLPDIVTLRIEHGDMQVASRHERILLRFSNRIADRGRGPLEISPSGRSHDCDGDGDPSNDRTAFQRVFVDKNRDRVFERGKDTRSEHRRFGCERYDPKARHWNVFDLARYELRRLRSGKAVVKSTKVAFCTVDSDRAFPGLPGSPTVGYYPRGGCDQHSTLGVSVGWSDEYYYGLPGQELDVTGLGAGRYCLVSAADPDHLLRESDDTNNVRKTRIELHPSKGTVRTLPGHCRASK